jgi:hypothetical protein
MNPILPKTGCSPIGEPLFPSVVWGKACIAIVESFPALRKFSERCVIKAFHLKKFYHHKNLEGHEGFK